ncbi:TetR/AcrR family transcriptional regulator [Sneathiella sp.]|uniref:TetR/AcrR family transcriptional regulator n=1 Tax=Sneathiella sp. TaxID=1964365 RepID=UPI0035669CB1
MKTSPTKLDKFTLRKATNSNSMDVAKKRLRPTNGRRTQAERTALSDERMFEAAKQIIIEEGTHSTTLKAIGERAGYSRGLASNRFGSKQALFGQLVVRFNDKWAEELASKVGHQTGTRACLSALCVVEGFLVHHSQYMKAMYILWFESISTDNEVRSHLADYHEIYRKDVASWVREGIETGEINPVVDPECYAFQFSSFIFGTIYQWLVAESSVDLAKQFRMYRELTEDAFRIRDLNP